MGICISKRERTRLIYSGEESTDEVTLESAKVFARQDYATRMGSQELSSYNVFFDEWGARFIESGSRRWHVIHMPGTTKFSLQEDKNKGKSLCGQSHLHSEEVYGDMSFSSYLSGPLMKMQVSCPASTPPEPNPFDIKNNASLMAKHAEKNSKPFSHANQLSLVKSSNSSIGNSTLAANSRQWTDDLTLDRTSSWIPVLTVERSQHTESSQEMISIKLRRHTANSFMGAEGENTLSAASIPESMTAGMTLSSMTSSFGEIGVFGAEKYFKANDQQRANQEMGLAGNDMHESGPAVLDKKYLVGSSAAGSEIQDDLQYRNSTAALSDTSYDSRSALSGAWKVASSDAVWSSSRSNSCNKRVKPGSCRVHTFPKKGWRWSCCAGKSAVDALDALGLEVSPRPKRHSIKVHNRPKIEPVYFCPADSYVAGPIKVKMAQSPPPSAYTAAPLITKVELPKSSQQSRHSGEIMNGLPDLPQALFPSAECMNLFRTAENRKLKSLDYSSAVGASHSNPASDPNRGRLFCKLSPGGKPGPMWVQSSGRHQHVAGSGILQLGKDELLGDGSFPVLQGTNVGSCNQDDDTLHIRNAEHRSTEYSFNQQSSATTQGHQGGTWAAPMVQNLNDWQVLMVGMAPDDVNGASGQMTAQVLPSTPSASHFEMGPSASNKESGPQQRASNNAGRNPFGGFVSSIQAKPCYTGREADVETKDDILHQKTIDRGDYWTGVKNADEPEVIGHIHTSMQLLGRKDSVFQKVPECFTFPNLVCLPSSSPLEERKQGIQHSYKDQSPGKEHSIWQLQKHEEQLNIQHHVKNYFFLKEQGVEQLMEEQSIQHLHKNPLSGEEKGTQQLYRGNSSTNTCTWSTESFQDERGSSPSGGSTPTTLSSGAGSAFGSPFSVAASCASSDYRGQEELIKRLHAYSQQSASHEYNIQSSIFSTLSSTQDSSNRFKASSFSVLDVNQDQSHAAKKFADAVHYILAHRHALGNESSRQVLVTDVQVPQGVVEGHNPYRLAQPSEDEHMPRKEEIDVIDSDSSSDLFDLDGLAGCSEGAQHSLPVFEMQSDLSSMLPGSPLKASDDSVYKKNSTLL